MRSKRKIVGLGLVAAAALFVVAPHAFGRTDRAAIARPHLLRPQAGASWMLPTFAWSAVKRADHYEFQLAADSKFNSPVLGGDGDFTTRNTRATVRKAPPNGRYWYRVRAVMKSGKVSSWAVGSVSKSWRIAPQLVSPADGAAVTYPTDPLILSWNPVGGAARYDVAIATESTFTNLVGVFETAATSLNPPASLPLGTYFWRVTPLDPEKNQGASSVKHSFTWRWPSSTTTSAQNLTIAYPGLDDPQISWNPVAGAARYELEINPSQEFAPGSRICCNNTTVATHYTPTTLLPNNTYYMRVRAIDARGNHGVWSPLPPDVTSFSQWFDNVGYGMPILQPTSIKNLRLADNLSDPGIDLDATTAGYQTKVPIIKWDPVWGASAYDLYVVNATSSTCDWTDVALHVTTPIPVYTPLEGSPGSPPYPTGGVGVEKGGGLIPGDYYCLRIRALTDTDQTGHRVYGDFTYLCPPNTLPAECGPSNGEPFDLTSLDSGSGNPTMSASDYLTPASGPLQGFTPLFTWKPISGAASYWVIVSRDASFTTLVDYAFTRTPAYAPRKTYADETTHYYYAVLPSCVDNGSSCVQADPRLATWTTFDKQSAPPTLLTPASGDFIGAQQPTFHWTPVQGTRYYTLQVSADPTFGSLLDDVKTDSTAYSSETTYPPGSTLYWRVRANDEDNIGLTWSSPRTFTHGLPAPVPFGSNATIGEKIPVWRWSAVPGAVLYDLHAILPDGSTKDVNGLPSPAFVAGLIAGNGIFRWSVRGEFPKSGGLTPGPYSPPQDFTKILTPPLNPHAIKGRRSLAFAWVAKATARKYRFQIARNQDFSKSIESTTTESNVYAPLMNQGDYFKGGKFYWRVAGIDDYGNVGKFSPTLVIRLPRRAH